MNIKRAIFCTMVLVLMAGTLNVKAAAPIDPEIYNSWTKESVNNDAPGVVNLSTIFVGKREIPFMIYVQEGINRINVVWESTESSPGTCGPDNKWHCENFSTTTNEGFVSNLATENYIDSFSVGWVYRWDGTNLYAYSKEFEHDMTYLSSNNTLLLQLGKFGTDVSLAGPPSIALSGGHFEMAVTLRIGTDFPVYKLVYLYYKGGNNSSCLLTGTSGYDCIVIEQTAIGGLMGPLPWSIRTMKQEFFITKITPFVMLIPGKLSWQNQVTVLEIPGAVSICKAF